MAVMTPERDWKYMTGIKDALLASLCDRITMKASAILANTEYTEHKKYLSLYQHVQDSDRIMAGCFDEWHRSTLFIKILEIRHHDLLTPDQLQGLSTETQEKLKTLEQHL
jgi:hypothetical protein